MADGIKLIIEQATGKWAEELQRPESERRSAGGDMRRGSSLTRMVSSLMGKVKGKVGE